MFTFIKNWRRDRCLKRLEAYKNIPSVLREMDECMASTAQEVADNPPFPPNEMNRRLGLVAEEVIKSKYPEIWPEIEKGAEEVGVNANDIAQIILAEVVLPPLLEVCKRGMEESMQEIERLCQEGVNEELGKLPKLK